jgi:hypothetical protein
VEGAAERDARVRRRDLHGARGELITTVLRRHRLRWWTQNQLQKLLLESGAEHVRCVGTDDDFMAIGDAPAA